MKLLDYFKMTISNLNKRKFRTLINIFSISIGVMLIVTMLSLGTGLENVLMSKIKELNNLKQVVVESTEYQKQEDLEVALAKTTETGDVDVDNLFKTKPIKKDTIEKLHSDGRIEQLTTRYESEVSEVIFGDKKAKEIKLAYYNGDFYLDSEKESLEEAKNNSISINNNSDDYIIEGHQLKNTDKNSVMLPESFVRNTLLIDDISSVIGKKISVKSLIPDYDKSKTFSKDLTIVGVINQNYYQPAFIVTKDVMEAIKNFETDKKLSLDKRGADFIELSVKNISQVASVTNYIQEELNYNTESVSTLAKTVDSVLFGIKAGLSVLGLIVIFIASLDVINTMIMSIHERTKLIGLMRATGASKKDIRTLFLVESATIGLLGGVFGVVFSYFGLIGIRALLIFAMNYFDIVDLMIVNEIAKLDALTSLFTIGFAILVTIIAGIYPAIKASNLNPIDAIRHD